MKRWLFLLLMGMLVLAAAGMQLVKAQNPQTVLAAQKTVDAAAAGAATAVAVIAPSSVRPTKLIDVAAACPVTRPPEMPFKPPAPWPAQPPTPGQFWFGDSGLWTALPADGNWRQLALGEKFWWWSEAFDVSEDATPDLIVTARRLDGDAPVFQASPATNGHHESFHWAMLMGVRLASAGCWEFTGQYNDQQLSFVLWVPSE